MPASTCTSHFSTAPLALDGWITVLSLISSPSSERMAVMSALPGWNSRVEMASKHFFKCGCTLVGSFVSERISSISSLERKKKRGKAMRLTSRYEARPFWISSRSWFASRKLSRPSLSRAMARAPGALAAFSIMSLHTWSTSWNFWPSSGICFMMSSEEKMGSRYCHVAWHVSQLSRRSCRVCMLSSHPAACSSNGLMNGEARMDWIFTIWSSRIAWMSSTPPRMYVPVSLYSMHRNSTPSQSVTIFSRAFSSEYSLEAFPESAWIRSKWSITPRVIRSETEKSSVGLCCQLRISKMASQCRSLSAGLASSSTSGITSLNWSMASLRRSTTPSFWLTLPILYALVEKVSTSAVMCATSRFTTGPCSHSWVLAFQSLSAFQSACRLSHSFSVRVRLPKSSLVMLKRSWYPWYVSARRRSVATSAS
mmetsp:Transcript_62799/g.198888  ORF Transcript_62799/g.198888 Transcript_62799/m.198888 type:complete len:424 (-) Transcript_62799:2007-3278(-)